MGKFIRKILILAVVTAIIITIVNGVFVKRYQVSPAIAKFKEIPSELDICNFGSSHGYCGFDYSNVNEKYECFNFALTEQTLSYDYRLFEEFGNSIKEGTIVFIPISYFSLWGEKEDYSARFEAKNKRYYSILSPDLIKDYSWEKDLLIRKIPVLGASTGDMIRVLLGLPLIDDNAPYQVATDIDIEHAAENAYYGHIIKYKFDEDGNRIRNDEEIEALYNLINECRNRGAIPILITTPYLKEYTDKVINDPNEFYEEYYGILDAISKETQTPYYDFAFDERFMYSYELFRDADHLNADGAKLFVDILLNEVVQGKTER